jgi:hypothetical protein
MFFRQIATLDAEAAKLDAAKAKGGDDLRQYYGNTLRLTADEANALKKNAASCNQILSDHAAKALNAIAVLKAASAPNTAGETALPPQVSQLQDERTELAFRCVQSLQSALSAQTFRNIDVYVRSAVAAHTAVAVPPMKPPTAPPSAGSDATGKGEGK